MLRFSISQRPLQELSSSFRPILYRGESSYGFPLFFLCVYKDMASDIKIVRRAFNAGEVSKEFNWRNDIEKHSMACETLENFYVNTLGGISRREGSRLLSVLGLESDINNIRIIPFEYNREYSFTLCFIAIGDEVSLKIFDIGGVEKCVISHVPIPSNCLNFSYKQVNGVVYFTHPEMLPQRLEMKSESEWIFLDKAIKYHPALDWEEDIVFKLGMGEWNSELSYKKDDIVSSTKSSSYGSFLITWASAIQTGNTVEVVVMSNNSSMYSLIENGSIVYFSGFSANIEIAYTDGTNETLYIGYGASGKYRQIDTTQACITVKECDKTIKWVAPRAGFGTYSDGAHSISTGQMGKYYIALKDVPAGTTLLNTEYWEEISVLGTNIPINSSGDFFSENRIGQQLFLRSKSALILDGVFDKDSAGETSANMSVQGIVTLRTNGRWDGTLAMEVSYNGGDTWSEIAFIHSENAGHNEELSREIYGIGGLVRVKMKNRNTADEDTGCQWVMSSSSSGIQPFEIISIMDSTHAIVTPLSQMVNGSDFDEYAEGAWCKLYGYPQCVEIHEERLVFGGNKRNPATIWLSETNNWDNFVCGDLDTDALSFTLATDSGEPVSWLVSKSDLMIGLGNCEWSLGSRDAGQALTSSLVHASEQSADGVEYIMPTKAGNMVIYVRRGGMELGSITYDFATDAYNSISLTTMNPKILGDGVLDIFNQLSPNNKIYIVRKDGEIAVFSYDKENNVAAWGRFIFGDGVRSACALSSGKFKSIFAIVRRNGYLCLERVDPNEMGTGNWLDCVPISDDMEIPEGLDTSIPYASLLRTTPLFLDGNARIFEVRFYLLNSYGGEYRIIGFDNNGDWNPDKWRPIVPRESELMNELSDIRIPRDYRFTGSCDSGFMEECAIEVKSREPAPFTLCAIGAKIKAM